MAATEQYFLVMLLIVPYKVVLTFDLFKKFLSIIIQTTAP